jgi:hypothetical protein
MSTFVFDSETLINHTLFRFKNIETGERHGFVRAGENSPELLKRFVHQPGLTFVGFNSQSFDEVILSAFIAGRTELEIKMIANDIIENRMYPREALRKYRLNRVNIDTIDLIEVAPSFVSLKAYGARMHMPLLQDMPIPHTATITPDQEPIVLSYCDNDCDTTEELLNALEKELLLRVDMSKQYGVDLRSKSDAQMAEQAYIKTMDIRRKDNKVPPTVRYTPPAFLKFRDAGLQALLERVAGTTFSMNMVTGHLILPDFLGKEIISFGTGTYQLGVGGIHSTHDRKVCYVAGEDVITDIDAASFYPTIILECGFVPEGLGQPFIDEYRRIYDRRIEAKRTGDKVTNETLKISLNGTFGKLASKYSVLYAPDLMLAVTLTGQFTLLMLIEWLEHLGAETLSANTDGLAMRYPARLAESVSHVVSIFESVSKFNFEYTPYRVLAMKDVNNYFAVKTDRKVKVKGIYTELSLKKNPTAGVCATAVGLWLAKGTPLLETIQNADFVDFISARNVTGGGQQGSSFLGKVVRWYQSNSQDLEPMTYIKNGNKVPKTDGARACMTIDKSAGHPSDLDYNWYHCEALRIAVNIGCTAFLTEDEITMITPVKIKKLAKVKNGTR